MNDKLKAIVTASVSGGVIALLVLFGVSFMTDDKEFVLPEDFNIADHIDLDSLKGDRGSVGATGATGDIGIDGSDGEDGSDGDDGTSFSFDLDELTNSVLDEIEDRDDAATFAFSGQGGNYSFEFEIDDADAYEFDIKHFGSGDIDVSIEDEDGNVSTLIDTEGHVSYNDTRTLNDEIYTLRVSADGNWSIEVTED